MPFVYNPITNELDLSKTGGSGGGYVQGPPSSINGDIAIFSGNTGTLIADSGINYTNVMLRSNNLSDVLSVSAARSNLGLGTLAIQNSPLMAIFGGTGLTSYNTGDTLYASSANTLSALPIGTSGQVLTVSGGIPAWSTPAPGGVTSVSGTLNRITSTGGTTPVIDISASYVGQSSIITLGTITTGTWTGTSIALAHGGTGADLSIGLPGANLLCLDTGATQFSIVPSTADVYFEKDDFVYGNTSILGPWKVSTNSGSVTGSSGAAGYPGYILLGVSGNGNEVGVYRYDDSQGLFSYAIGDGYTETLFVFNIPTLSNGTDNFILTMGLGQIFGSYTSSEPGANACFIQYNIGTSLDWIVGCYEASSFTAASGGSTTAVATGWHVLQIAINAAGTNVSFTLDKTINLGSCTTGIPTENLSPGMKIRKTLGNGAVFAYWDYWSGYKNLTIPRF